MTQAVTAQRTTPRPGEAWMWMGAGGVSVGVLVGSLLRVVRDDLKATDSAVAIFYALVTAGFALGAAAGGIVALLRARSLRGGRVEVGPDGVSSTLRGKTKRIAWRDVTEAQRAGDAWTISTHDVSMRVTSEGIATNEWRAVSDALAAALDREGLVRSESDGRGSPIDIWGR